MQTWRTSPISRPRIAVVEPDEAVRDSLVFSLTVEGYVVAAFPNAARFLGSLVDAPHDCLVTASDLPDGSGVALIDRWLRLHAGGGAVLMAETPDAAVQLRHVETVFKPLDGAAVIRAVAHAVRKRPSVDRAG